MKKKINYKIQDPRSTLHTPRLYKGFLVLEIVLAAGLFAVFSLAIVQAVFKGSSIGQRGEQTEVARLWAREGIEGVRAVRDRSYDALSNSSGTGIRFESGNWEFFGENDAWEGYQRVITIQPARRDGDGNVVLEGGSEDADLKLAISTVTKDNFSVELSAYFSRREIIIP